MRKSPAIHLLCAALIALSCWGSVLFAAEPANLATNKQQIIRYYNSGEYSKDVTAVINKAMADLKAYINNPPKNGKKPAIILDIDETSLSNYNDLLARDFGGTPAEIQQDEDKGTDPVIAPTLALYEYAKAHHVAVFFLTGRTEAERDITSKNLHDAGYNNWDGLILRYGPYLHSPAAVYKAAMREKIEKQGFDIIINIGDQQSDLNGGHADKTYKLPNPFYFIP